MLRAILNKKIINHRNIVYFFSKDPFEKFNRKKDNKPEEAAKGKTPEKGKDVKGEKILHSKQAPKTKKQPESIQPSPNLEKEQHPNSLGFNKFQSKRRSPGKEEGKDKDRQQAKEKKQQLKLKQQEKARQEENKKSESESYFKQQKTINSKSFQKFNRRSPPQKQEDRSLKQEKIEKEKKMSIKGSSQARDQQQQNKKNQIPTQNIKLEEDEKDNVVLRRPRGLKAKQPKEELTSFLNEIQQPQQGKEEAQPEGEGEGKGERSKEEERWQAFEQEKERLKGSHKRNLMRFERENLLKQGEEKEKEKSEKPGEPTNIRKNLIRLVVAGVGLIMVSNNEYFSWSSGKEVEPQYLQGALEEGRVVETWAQNTQVDVHNEESLRGKSLKKFIYIRQANGDIAFCVSNQQFQNVWFALVEQKNRELDSKMSEAYPMNTQNDVLSRRLPPAKKIVIGGKHEDRKSSLVADSRSILSLVLLYFFTKSIIDMSKGARGKGGKGAAGLFENEKSHRFKEILKVTFQDVVGMQKAKDEIVQFIDFLKYPAKYNKLGARIPKGALLTGPPGTGKTMIAKACAGESKVPFFTISGSEFIEMYVGVGAQRVRNLFKEAKENAPSIIFIDEIDAVGKKRSGLGGGGNDERDTTLNQLLVQMDGFDTDTNVIVFAATNQKEVLDPALTRPGRFDRLIEVQLPDIEGRCQIFQVHLKPLVLDSKIDIKEYAKRLATLTPGFSGADIKNVCNEAAIIAARNNKEYVTIMDFELATERIIGGVEKKSQLITPETRKIVAYHECGHGVVSWFIENANPLLKLTIIPRSKGALGFAQYLPNEHQMYTKAKLLDEICVILGGRIAEEIFFSKISTGASDDLNKAYQVAKAYVTHYGFGEKLGWIQYDETEYVKQYSRDIENKIDEEILELMRVCSERTRTIITEKKDLIHRLAEKLLEIETIDQTIIQGILGARGFKLSKQHSQYIKQKKRMSQQLLGVELPKPSPDVKMRRIDFVL